MRIRPETILSVCSLISPAMAFGCRDVCTELDEPAVSGWPEGYLMEFDVEEPCGQYTTCVECLPGPTGQSMCQWCGNPDGTGACISKGTQCGATQSPLADHWNGYCPEFCDRMDGTSCTSCTNQMDPFDEGCSWCPETQDCFNERASVVALQPSTFCGATKAGDYGVPCSGVPATCAE